VFPGIYEIVKASMWDVTPEQERNVVDRYLLVVRWPPLQLEEYFLMQGEI